MDVDDLACHWTETVFDEYTDLVYLDPVHPLSRSFYELRDELGDEDDTERLFSFIKPLFSFVFEVFFELGGNE